MKIPVCHFCFVHTYSVTAKRQKLRPKKKPPDKGGGSGTMKPPPPGEGPHHSRSHRGPCNSTCVVRWNLPTSVHGMFFQVPGVAD